jgi:hypothetical protein
MVAWIVDETGACHRLVDPFQPRFYAAGPARALRQLAADLDKARLAAPVGMTSRQEFWTGEPKDVLEFSLLDPEQQPALLRRLAVPRPGITLYDCDLPLGLSYCHARGVFPLARVTVRPAEEQGSGGAEGRGGAISGFGFRVSEVRSNPGTDLGNRQSAIGNCPIP